MSRTLRSRALAALLGLWFLAAGQEPPFPHPCEMGGRVAHAGPEAPSEHGSHDEHAAHGGHAGHEASPAPDEAPDHAPDACECVDCCTPVAVVTPCEATVAAAVTAPARRGPITATAARAADVTPRLLPFANGPPATLS